MFGLNTSPELDNSWGGTEKEVAPEFSVEDSQTLALLIQTQLEVARRKINTRDEACVMSNGLLYLVCAGKGVHWSGNIFIQ